MSQYDVDVLIPEKYQSENRPLIDTPIDKEVNCMHYVCCDIHGQHGLFRELLSQIDFKDSDTLYILGDVIDRGPDGIGILMDIMARENVEMFVGNHELMMMDYLSVDPDRDKASWFYGNNGGEITCRQFMELAGPDKDAVLAYLDSAWIQKYVEVDGTVYALHHSYYLPDRRGEDVRYCDEKDDGAIFKAVWYSPYRYYEHVRPGAYDDGCVHLLGHVPVQNLRVARPPYYNEILGDRLINLDGGCALLYFGREGGLYCMSLEKDDQGKHREFWIPGSS